MKRGDTLRDDRLQPASDKAEGGVTNQDGYILVGRGGFHLLKVHDEHLVAAIAVAWELSRKDKKHRTIWVFPSDSRGETSTSHAWYVLHISMQAHEGDIWWFGFNQVPEIY